MFQCKQAPHLLSSSSQPTDVVLLTYAFQSRLLPHPGHATHRGIAAPPAVIPVHTAVDHYASVMPHHLRVRKEGNWAAFSCEKTVALNDWQQTNKKKKNIQRKHKTSHLHIYPPWIETCFWIEMITVPRHFTDIFSHSPAIEHTDMLFPLSR